MVCEEVPDGAWDWKGGEVGREGIYTWKKNSHTHGTKHVPLSVLELSMNVDCTTIISNNSSHHWGR